MNVDSIRDMLRLQGASLRLTGEDLVIQGPRAALRDAQLVGLIKSHKAKIVEQIRNGVFFGSSADLVEVAPNLITMDCERICPELLPLVQLSQEEIDRVVATVPGGVRNVQDIYPLVPLQEGILFHHRMSRDGDPYLLWMLISVADRAKLDAYVAALNAVIARHDILRTAVIWEGLSEPVQVVWRRAALQVEEVRLDAEAGDVVGQLEDRCHPRHCRVDVKQAPMMRLYVAQDTTHDRWVGMQLCHHLALDHMTIEVMNAEIQIYLAGRVRELATDVLPFRCFVSQIRQKLARHEHEAFFRQMLEEVEEPTTPFGLIEVHGDGSGIAEASREVGEQLSSRLRKCARALGVSTASVFHVAWAQVLARASGQDDPVFGTVVFGRMHDSEGMRQMMGPFINTLPVRIRLREASVERCVRETHQLLAQLLLHEHAPLAEVQQYSQVPAGAPLFTALLNYRRSLSETQLHDASPGAPRRDLEYLAGEERTNYPLTLSVNDREEGFGLTAQVNPAVGAERLCAMMLITLERVVAALETKSAELINELEVLPAQEREQLLVQWNEAVPYPKDRCIHELFEAQVSQSPASIALIHEGQQLCYGELNRRANQLAHYLRACGVSPDQRVAICMERSFELIVGLLGILKAGGAYVPLDPAYPAERLAFMLSDSAPVVSVSHGPARAVLEGASRGLPRAPPIIDLDTDEALLAQQPTENLDPRGLGLTSQHLAYIIYTSGSSGRPKGVMVEHASIARLFSATEDLFHFNSNDVWTLFHSFAFDFSVWEIWGALINLGRLVVVPQLTTRSPEELYELICREGVTVLNQTPSAFRQLIAAQGGNNQPHRLRHVIFGGEALDVTTLKPWYQRSANRHVRLVNMYGITEITVHATYRSLEPADADGFTGSPIGRRIPDSKLYIVDAHRRPVPIGVMGEIYIGGAGVARGYWNRADLTAERFIASPFVDGDRLYKTGDLARYLPDGNIEFLGRTDFQVKIRGFRIELGEIEARLLEYPGVREAVVLAREDEPGDKRLVAYHTTVEGAEVTAEALRGHVSRTLASYMVPAAYVQLASLPLTQNGKLDRRALPAPDDQAYVTRGYEAPRGAVEQSLAAVWSEVLKVKRVGRHDNFFELGGHSLLAMRVLERMRRAGLPVDVRTLFLAPTLSELAALAGQASALSEAPPNLITTECEQITPELLPLVQLSQEEIDRVVSSVPGGVRNVQDIYGLTPLQEGILFHHLMSSDGDPYLLWTLMSFGDRAKLDAYAGALNAVIARHDILRTAVIWEGLCEPVQVVWRQAALQVEEVMLDAEAGDVVGQFKERFPPRRCRLDVRQAPMMRLYAAWDAPNTRWLMLWLAHHLVDDFPSARLLEHEIGAHLSGRAEELPEALPFRHFVAHLRQGRHGDMYKAFFSQMLEEVDEPTAPFGLMEVHGDGSEITESSREVSPLLSSRLRKCARVLGVSAASLFHVAWAQVLSRASARNEPVFGTVVLGRMHGSEGVERVMGPFINTLPVRIRLKEVSVEQCVRETHRLLAQLLLHEHASLAEVKKFSRVPPPLPLFTALLNYHHNISAEQVLDASRSAAKRDVESLIIEGRTNYPLTLSVNDQGEGFELTAQVAPTVGAERLCAMMLVTLEHLATALEETPTQAVSTLDVLPPPERQQLLVQWNDTDVSYSKQRCIHELFEAQVAQSPESIALIYAHQQLRYGELNRRANQLSHYLRSLRVGPDQRVAICMERSIELIVGLLGILKAGAAYVPLDPAYPAERLAYMLSDSAPVVALSHGPARSVLEAAAQELPQALSIIDLDADAALWAEQLTENLHPHRLGLTSQHLAYIIYTSGSTGRPKGIAVAHAPVINLVSWVNQTFAVGAGDSLLFVTSICFDLSVYDIFGMLAAGGKIWLAKEELVNDPQQLAHILCREGITFWDSAPAALQLLVPYLKDQPTKDSPLRLVFNSGDWIPLSLPTAIASAFPRVRFISLGGATEATVWSNWYEVREVKPEWKSIPYGRPIQNARYYILDRALQPVPLGVTGDLYIGGECLAKGYTDEDLSRERFLASPFVAGDRLYKTGDQARHFADGNIEFLGRTDFQVKIRGFRIELGEIEARMLEHPGVREAVVLAREDEPGDKRLVAYYTIVDGAEVTAEALRGHVSRTLASYMVPAAYVHLSALPVTQNGKLDRKALPAPDGQSYVTRSYEPPISAAEIALAEIWSEVLKVERVGRHDNFFELGGHSLLAMRVLERMRRAGLPVDVRTLFLTPTLSELAALAGQASALSEAPPNLITPECERITPELLPLVSLTQEEIDRVVANVSGGVRNTQDIYALAPLQEGILFHHLMSRDGDPYLLWTLMSFGNRAKLDAYVAAFNAVIARHDILRTAVLWEGLSEPVQVVWREAALQVEEVRLDAEAGDVAGQIKERCHPRHGRLDVRQAPMMRLYVAQDPISDRWVGMQLCHHLALDHTTIEVMNAEMQAYLSGRAYELPEVLPFRCFVSHIRQRLAHHEHEAFFRQMLEDIDEPTAPFGLMEVYGDGSDIVEASCALDQTLSSRLRRCARALGVSTASLFHVAWAQVLSRASGRDKPVFGTVVFGRMHGSEGMQRVMGPFINTLPVRICLRGVSVEQCVRETHQVLAQLLLYEHAPLAEVQQYSQVSPGAPLFTGLLNYRHNVSAAQLLDVSLSPAEREVEYLASEERTNYPLTLSVNDLGQGFALSAQVVPAVGADRVCAMMLITLEQMVTSLETKPGQLVSDLEVLTSQERERLLLQWNETAVPNSKDRCIHELFEAKAATNPEAIALIHEDRALSYAELNARANQLAHYLRSSVGVGPDQRVALCVERSFELIVGLLGILKAGGVYVPLDPSYPAERLAFMLRDSAAMALLTHAQLRPSARESLQTALVVVRQLNQSAMPLIDLQADAHRWKVKPESNFSYSAVGVTPAHLAYVIFTSGSTGIPKAAGNSIAGLANRLTWFVRSICQEEPPTTALKTSIGFVDSVTEILQTLVAGGTLVVFDEETTRDIGLFAKQLGQFRITTLVLVPSLLVHLLEVESSALDSIKTLICSGEQLAPELIRGVKARYPQIRLFNFYGSSEVNGDVTALDYAGSADALGTERSIIGRPIWNTQIYILDAYRRPVPIGVIGEIYIGGAGVARGYLNRVDLTAERFIASPFAEGDRLYRTGDLARYLPDGNIEFLGRTDFQVKIRGFRIELGEIEARLLEHPGVREVVVLAREDEPGDKRLVAYYTIDEGAEVTAEVLRGHVSRTLGSYMVPAAYVPLASLPLTQNGKLDRQKLPTPDGKAYATRGYEAPRGSTEIALAEIWSEVLKIERVGRHDSFFELGGHSLLAVKVIVRAAERFTVPLNVLSVFQCPTIRKMAQLIEELARHDQRSSTSNEVEIEEGIKWWPRSLGHWGKRIGAALRGEDIV